MTSGLKGRDFAFEGNDFAQNAGFALNALIDEPNRDKMIARTFGVSLRMAKYLREGKHWTVDRLTMASALLGRDFDVLVINPLRSSIKPDEIHDRIDAVESDLETEISLLRSELHDGFYQVLCFLGALVRGEANRASVAENGASTQEASEPALVAQ